MTPFPYSLSPADPLDRAQRLMAEHGFRHLPVMENERPAGVITDDDIRRAVATATAGAPPRVGDVERSEACVVDSSAPLDLVLTRMAERHLDSALVLKGGRLVGIFTVTDACRLLAELLRRESPAAGGDEAA